LSVSDSLLCGIEQHTTTTTTTAATARKRV
jgi:hypothetical protein